MKDLQTQGKQRFGLLGMYSNRHGTSAFHLFLSLQMLSKKEATGQGASVFQTYIGLDEKQRMLQTDKRAHSVEDAIDQLITRGRPMTPKNHGHSLYSSRFRLRSSC